jgi:hypothetical protein
MSPDNPEYVTLKQAVEKRSWLTERWLRQAVAERRLPFSKVDGKIVFDLADLDAYVAAHRISAREPVQ